MNLVLRCVVTAIAIVSSVVLGGCATTLHEGPKFKEAPPPPAGEALVYVYRAFAPPFYFSPEIHLDSTKVADLANKGYTHLYVKPGEYTIKSRWPAIAVAPGLEGKFSFAPGQTYFVRLGGSMDFTTKRSTITSTTTSSSLAIVDSNVGMQEIAQCMYIQPVVDRIR